MNGASSLAHVPTGEDRLSLIATFPRFAPGTLFDYWSVPALLQRWWPQEATIDRRVGGTYHLSWPAMDWHLRGTYTDVRRGEGLAFTWHWDHEADAPVTTVALKITPLAPEGSQLVLIHGEFAASEVGQRTRQEHLEGWMHFLARLQSVQPPA
ncbi:MAG: hypothetical protein PVSMB4_17250 [Ktedonobacterales bacterium]